MQNPIKANSYNFHGACGQGCVHIHYETEESHKLTIQTDCSTYLKVLYMTYEM